jgi:membrane fusion protein, multidrug efflux system
VLVVEAGKVQQRSVTTGARGEVTVNGNTEAAIEVSGVAEGATVLRGSVGALRDGTLAKLPGAAPAPKLAASAPAP